MDKKRSPTSTVDFDDVEEMKIAPEDEHYQESLVRIFDKLAPPLTEESRARGRRSSFDDHNHEETKKASLSPQKKPPLMPMPARVGRSSTDPSSCMQGRQGERAMMSLADDCVSNRDLTTALALYKHLLLELEKKYGREHPQTAECIHKIGEAYLLRGDFHKATSYLKSAIDIRSMVLGVHHLDVANSMEKLGVAELHLNEVEHAHDVYRRALRIKRSLLGLYHEDVAHIQTQLACIYFYSGELLSAQAAFEESLDVYRYLSAQPTGDHSLWAMKAADAICSIGSIKLSQGKYPRAIGLFTDALKVSLGC